MTDNALVDPYWSRTGEQCELATRMDPVVWPNNSDAPHAGPLNVDQLTQYELDGYYHSTQLLSHDEAQELLDEAERLAQQIDRSDRGVVTEPDSDIVRSVFRLHPRNDRFRALAHDPRLVNIARQLLGGDVYIHQSRINFKPAFDGKEFFWHSDFETWHMEDGMPRMRAVSVSISLTGSNEFNGPLMVVPGSHWTYVRCAGETPQNHYEQSLKKQEYGVPSRAAMAQLVKRGNIVAPKGPPGSALFFDCNLMHGSGGNLSPYPRTNLFFVYNSVENGLMAPYAGTPPRPTFLGERTVTAI